MLKMFAQREVANIINVPIPHWLGTLWIVPDSFGCCRGYSFEYTGHAVTALTKLVYFKGSLAFLVMCHPTQVLW